MKRPSDSVSGVGNVYTGDLNQLVKKGVNIRSLDANWVKGTYKDLEFQAKIYSEPSKFGINQGRTSKLFIRKLGSESWADDKILFSYDRGYEVRPKTKTAKELVRILSTGNFGP